MIALAVLAVSCSRGEKASGAPGRGSACGLGIITIRDVTGILRDPIDGSRSMPEDPESCVFTTGGHSRIEVAMRPARGKITVDSWIAGSMALQAVPLLDVGDQAAWQRDLHEVIAERNDVLCDISVIGAEKEFIDTTESVLKDRIGRLCNKVLGSVP